MNIQQQFEKLQSRSIVPMFEIPVIDKKTGEKDYVIFDISVNENEIIAQHVALNSEEESSPKIAYKAVDIDEDFSLDHHLQEIYSECINALISSEFYELHDFKKYSHEHI
jgi:hypothetical protein